MKVINDFDTITSIVSSKPGKFQVQVHLFFDRRDTIAQEAKMTEFYETGHIVPARHRKVDTRSTRGTCITSER